MFSAEVFEPLGYYVYILIDPRTDVAFYVGKGTGNRVFSHINAVLPEDDETGDLRLQTIKDICSSGHEVKMVIHRHGMDESTAFEVEAAIIDILDSLTNLQGGRGSADRGPMSVNEIRRKLSKATATMRHSMIAITINKTIEKRGIYDAVRFQWRVSRARAEKAQYVLAVDKGIIVGVFEPLEWKEATPENFPGFSDPCLEKRVGFVGREAPAEVCELYINQRIPDQFSPKGARNPIRYINC